jgi:hypothetical protein
MIGTLRTGAAIILAVSLGPVGGAGANRRQEVTFEGKIIAYRPADRVLQVPSFVVNKESFLFSVRNPPPKFGSALIKLVYEHFGYSDLGEAVLQEVPVLRLKVRRDASCDEAYRRFVSGAPTIRDQSGGDLIQGVSFIGKYRGIKISPDQVLKCYVLEEGGFKIENLDR